ncbi:Asp-tRNA(Asn)/Glu-tRNA(Gln) amidotransferase subunit GatB [bacterium]|nr:Asp-tRNA(Asn)/Glu-tRNA(Gln) amidotransferase subunit GatB [bacterium]
MSRYRVVIGLEVHTQLLTQTKLFSGCINRFNPDAPNTQTDPVTLALPGTLPVMNRKAFRLAVRTAMALNCEIARFTKWDRKQYFYPDLPKGYQISQFDLPFSSSGFLEIDSDLTDEPKRIRINRVHLEDDAGKNMHDESGRGGNSQVDLNRAGTPLLEIVSEPDMSSAFEARRYLEELRLLLTYLGVSDCNMQEGSLRCDANVNLHVETESGETIATPIVEIKNMNSIRGVEAAIEYEAKRQFKQWEETKQKIGDVPKQTRGWNADRGTTFAQRGKEEASDYRYFPDPDLVPVTVSDEFLAEIRGELLEFPQAKKKRFLSDYQLSDYDAGVIVDQGQAFSAYFETVAETCSDGKQAANWVTQDVQRELNDRGLTIEEFFIPAEVLGTLLKRIVAGDLTNKGAREVFAAFLETPDTRPETADVDRVIEEKGLKAVTDTGAIDAIIDQVLARNQKVVEDVKGGKQQAVGPLIGQVMKELKGADPKTVRQMLLDRIAAS